MQTKMKQNVDTRVKDIITVNGKQFRDLNGNGVLDPYENWELPIKERVQDLLSKMTLEEKAGLMTISSQYMPGSSKIPGDREATETDESGLLNETDVVLKTHPFSKPGDDNYELPSPLLYNAGTTKGILDLNLRYFIVRDNPKAADLAEWTNKIQEVAENSRLGIPAVMVSNPRNHIGYLYHGLMEASGQFSIWPGELGLAATDDEELVKEYAEIAAKEWRAAGLHKMYGYMADIATDPLWMRYNGTFGEDPHLAAKMIKAMVEGFQGKKLGQHSVSMTTKHFPGGGARHKGHDPHYPWGSFNPYPTPGSLYQYHIPPFKAAIEAGTTSMMPYYSYPSNEHSVSQLRDGALFEEIGFAYNKAIVHDILRKELGFKGYINSDTGIINMMPWGVEHLSAEERYAKALDTGVNMFSDEADPSTLIKAVQEGLVSEEKLDQSVTYLLTEMMELGLFENPYVEKERAQEIAKSPVSQEKADEAHRKSVVLMRNDDLLLPLKDDKLQDTKLYVEVFQKDGAEQETTKLKKTIKNYDSSIVLTDNLEEATHAFIHAVPTPVPDRPDEPLSVTLGLETGIDVKRIKEIEKKVPTILGINMTNPWLIGEIEPQAAAVISTFGIKYEPLIDVLRGRFQPTGKLPFTLPANQEVLDKSPGDIPGHAKDSKYAYRDTTGNAYQFGYGITY
ncbi:glycoside hydrolase family 3 N-terminal domain-containing protein [Gracilibacillus sp. YIM 98692]|uniref:glycoside hydrolase family 3 protein n=1 Tax=Gracilibacillus sp. YIM 98692 TaxID=2663532 RepID=UPI0013D7E169|nr:glycoside hydrolase family 3 N-terminal domain-containing protein [Gracilibacillus sp. YIM 98692]